MRDGRVGPQDVDAIVGHEQRPPRRRREHGFREPYVVRSCGIYVRAELQREMSTVGRGASYFAEDVDDAESVVAETVLSLVERLDDVARSATQRQWSIPIAREDS